MSDPDPRLAAKLARLAGKEEILPGGARRLAERGDGRALVALLDEVDDTILEAALSFESAGERLTLMVSGRRILSIEEASKGLRVDPALIGVPLAPEDEEIVAAVQDVLNRFTAPADQLIAAVGQGIRRGSETDLGLSPAQFDQPEDLPTQNTVLGRVAVASSPTARVLLKDGEIIHSEGPDHVREALEAVLEKQLLDFDEARFAASDGHIDPSLTCICGVMPDDLAVAMAVVATEIALFALPIEDLPRLHSLWRVTSD